LVFNIEDILLLFLNKKKELGYPWIVFVPVWERGANDVPLNFETSVFA
jgi:hypothetical protein